ncbi:bifunctional glutamate N-acetyltransferase/amino-acid acetyltransferase ArgJ [Microbulbifer sp. 2205BS26-8]|uniref:bifunctional glutamate N-acetyltransferase/amino-acid acetyltransferase ArgJ n=1 Tax=Microbulbifer sp. 2205BS26-8 TaxID=3064386 RepID=UPI00273F22A3|nr:bifunctional glutamate N-acetyltransferase/amino-acid acetyltransferase ArgJ [Microbulbifer sp. 2205BS26-8]MDP5208992.1 bifunctional glutamate N-acetyltransferase/amino-acid acetyltransferase ArgJ [Microbulbifer sp. 2205BS26-8]
MAQSPLPPVKGVRLASVPAGLQDWQRDDLLLVEIDKGAAVSAVFTQNPFAAAPVVVAREHLRRGRIRALLVNAGNANAATGAHGLEDARACCAAVAETLAVRPEQVLPFSTGVIGEHLPLQKLLDAIPPAAAQLCQRGWDCAAQAILTTDTRAKTANRTLEINGEQVTVTGIAKGAGMIQPNMATMLAYVATDAAIAQSLLDTLAKEAVGASFNRICVDGDTSTNDACVLIATGAAGGPDITPGDAGYRALRQAITEVHIALAQAIVQDGEGASKFVTVQVTEAKSPEEALAVAFAVGRSPLVKTALYASDPNWGRLVMAIGNGIRGGLDTRRVHISLDEVAVVEAGSRAPGYREAQGAAVFAKAAFTIHIALGRGHCSEHIWTCDFSHGYVTINAEYRS